jgi:hypothetical protein
MAAKLRRLLILVTVCLASLSPAQTARADLIQAGGTYTVTGTDFVTNYSQNVTVDGATHPVDSGQLQVNLDSCS